MVDEIGPAKEGASAVVIGAGLSGLTAAYRLKQAGFKVTVLEKNDYPGGRVLTIRDKGYVMDAGPDAVSTGYKNYLALAKELGLGEKIVPSSPVMGAVKDQRVHDIHLNNPFSMLLTRVLSWPGKLKFAMGVWRIRHLLKGLDNFALVDSAHLDDGETTAQGFGEKYFGKEVTDYLIDPVMRLVAGSGARVTTHLGFLGGLKAWSSPLVNVMGGLDVMPKTIASHLNVVYEAEVTGLERDEQGVTAHYRDKNNEVHVVEADVCVIGAMYHVARTIYPELDALVGDYDYDDVNLISIKLGYRKLTKSKAYAIQVPTVEYPDVLLIFLQHNKAPDRAPEGCSVVTLYTDTLCTDRYLDKSDDELVDWAQGEMEQLFPELAGHLEVSCVSRWPKAGYLATPGFFKRTSQVRKDLLEDARVQIAGDLFGAGSMESAVTWGENATKNIIEKHQ